MNLTQTSTCQILAEMQPMFQRLADRARELRLELSVWDPDGKCVGDFEPDCDVLPNDPQCRWRLRGLHP